ncbi:polyprenyl diphosphate synthase [Immundisolibacter sp.]|uniref:polyprenyl diphosphate synthase n=1 Tax=Immundisolibacter sp. TaxID=1934948 RepID=UPI0026364986|nr:polyprenyl diphosphate synthase [Immundisolibacter sp.]MDD3650940.1 polyprenyl diphosphate synthase [Immundisolibacter sp.]
MTTAPTTQPPRHLAVIMDGNGRWARQRHLPRVAGHRVGARVVRRVVEECARRGVGHLTLFAFSSENWRRPADEVSVLMELFVRALRDEELRLQEHDVRLSVIGERGALPARLQDAIARVEARTADCRGLHLHVAANYGGQWDIVQAARSLAAAAACGALAPDAIDEAGFAARLALGSAPPVDLLIRTGGELRISNFLLWHLAYAELYFTDTLWPDFDIASLDQALAWYAGRERRFGRTGEQVQAGAAGA